MVNHKHRQTNVPEVSEPLFGNAFSNESDDDALNPEITEVTLEDSYQKSLMPLPVVHSDLDEYGLDSYEFRIYAHVVRRTGGKLKGECFAKLKKTAEICNMSVRKAQYSLKTLCEAGLLFKVERRGRTDIYKLAPKSNWKPKEELPKIRQAVKVSKTTDSEKSS